MFLCQNSLSLFVFKVLENQRKSIFWELYFVLHFIYQSRSFPKYFLYCFIFKYFIFSHNWAIISNPIFRIFVLWENYLWSFEIRKRVFVIFVITKCISFFALYHLLCRDLCIERGVVYSQCKVVIPWWRSLCERSCMDIVKIFLCEGGNVEQWLGPRNISWCLCLIHYLSALSLYFALLLLFIFIC